MSFNASSYAYTFIDVEAPAYAREWLDDNPEASEDDVAEWAHETADGMGAVIYTYQALTLYASGLFDNEDDEGHAEFAGGESAQQVVNQLVTGLSYAWHRRILESRALGALGVPTLCSHDGGRCAHLACPN